MTVFADSGGAAVIKVGDECYELVGVAAEPANVTPEDTFETCEECESSQPTTPSDDPSSEAPSSEVPKNCISTWTSTWDCVAGEWQTPVILAPNLCIDPNDIPLTNQWYTTGEDACTLQYDKVDVQCTETADCGVATPPPVPTEGEPPICCPSSEAPSSEEPSSEAPSSEAPSSDDPIFCVQLWETTWNCDAAVWNTPTKNGGTSCMTQSDLDTLGDPVNEWWLSLESEFCTQFYLDVSPTTDAECATDCAGYSSPTPSLPGSPPADIDSCCKYCVTQWNTTWDCATESWTTPVEQGNASCFLKSELDGLGNPINDWFYISDCEQTYIKATQVGDTPCSEDCSSFTETAPAAPVAAPTANCCSSEGPSSVAPSEEPSSEEPSSAAEDCPHPDTCGTDGGNGYPTIEMTLTWPPADTDETKTWMGCTWCRGQTKTLYATTYLRQPWTGTTPSPTVRSSVDRWWMTQGTGGLKMSAFTFVTSSISTQIATLSFRQSNVGKKDVAVAFTAGTPFMQTNDLGVLTVGAVPPPGGAVMHSTQKNNSYTDASGITYTWTEGTGW